MSAPTLYSFASTDTLAFALRKYVLHAQSAALQHHKTFRLAVSGGSLPAVLAKGLLNNPDEEDGEQDKPLFSSWDIFFADERLVPLDHPDSNYKLLKDELLDKIPSSHGQPTVHPIDASLLGKNTPQDIADAYQDDLRAVFAARDSVKVPIFDLVLLGCGPDGHTCSLFPGHELLNEHDAWVAAIADSPKPPSERITLTMPVVTHAVRVAFVATGEGKKGVMKRIFDQRDRELPCVLVNEGGGERVSWFTDESAVGGVEFAKKGNL